MMAEMRNWLDVARGKSMFSESSSPNPSSVVTNWKGGNKEFLFIMR